MHSENTCGDTNGTLLLIYQVCVFSTEILVHWNRHICVLIKTSPYDLLEWLPTGGESCCANHKAVLHDASSLSLNPRHGSIKPVVGQLCARSWPSTEYDFSGNNGRVNLGVLNSQWGYDLQLLKSLVILEECANEREQSHPHQASRHGKKTVSQRYHE